MNNFESNPLKKNLHCIIKLAKSDVDKRFAREKVGITPLQYGVLLMTKSKPITIHEIASHFSFKSPSLVPAVDVLEQNGLLSRKADSVDRRKVQLVITKKGLDLIKRLPLDDKNDALNQAFKKLSAAKQKQLLSLLQELIENFPK
jgi:DNA-binding MarR family transcriptional regulator